MIDSLTARDALDPRRSGWLWAVHTICALAWTRGCPRVVVDYDRLLAAPAHELARVAAALALPPPAAAAPATAAYVDGFLATELRHAQYAPDAPAGDALPPVGADAHALAQRLARDDAHPADPAVCAEVEALRVRLAALAPLLAYAGDVERAADEVPRLAGELAWARASLASARAWHEDLQAAVGRKEAEMREARAYNDDLAATVARKDAELREAHATLARLSERALGRMLLKRIRG